MGEGLAQGPYVVARVGFEPATARMQGIGPNIEKPYMLDKNIYIHTKLSD